jgi:hypothetical protein
LANLGAVTFLTWRSNMTHLLEKNKQRLCHRVKAGPLHEKNNISRDFSEDDDDDDDVDRFKPPPLLSIVGKSNGIGRIPEGQITPAKFLFSIKDYMGDDIIDDEGFVQAPVAV